MFLAGRHSGIKYVVDLFAEFARNWFCVNDALLRPTHSLCLEVFQRGLYGCCEHIDEEVGNIDIRSEQPSRHDFPFARPALRLSVLQSCLPGSWQSLLL